MTISSSTRKAGPFTGNGVTVAFPFAFKVFSASDLLVVLALTSTGAETVQTITTNYTVALNSDQSANPGGAVTMLVAPAAGYTLTLTSQVANLQPTDLTNAGGFYPKVINDALDRATIQIQQLAEKVGRALKLPVSSTASADLPTPVGGTVLGWNATGTAIVNFVLSAGTSLVNLAVSVGSSLIGFIQAGIGAVLRTVQDKLRERVSVEDFGAVGDGVADDTAAIIAAIGAAKLLVNWSSLSTTGGVIIDFSKPQYKIASNIADDLSGIIFCGRGKGGTLLDGTGSAAVGVPLIHAIRAAGAQRVVCHELRDLSIACKTTIEAYKVRNGYECASRNVRITGGSYSFHIEDGNYYVRENCEATGFAVAGFYSHGQLGSNTLQYVYDRRGRAYSGTGPGFLYGPGADFEVDRCYSSGNTGKGFSFARAAGANTLEAINIKASYADQNGDIGWYFQNARWIDARGIWSSNFSGGAAAGKHGVHLDTCQDSKLSGINAFDNTGDGVRLTACSGITVSDWNADANANAGVRVETSSHVRVLPGVSGATVSSSGGVQDYGVQVDAGCYKVSLDPRIDVRAAAIAKYLIADASNLDTTQVNSGIVQTAKIPFLKSAQANNTFFDFITLAIPNQIVNAQLLINYTANSADGQLVRSGQVRVLVARYAGNNTVATYTESIAQASVQPVGAETIALSFNLGAVVGGATVEQTIGIQARLVSSTGGSSYIRGVCEIVGCYFQNADLGDNASNPYVRAF